MNIELVVFELESLIEETSAFEDCVRDVFRRRGLELSSDEIDEIRGMHPRDAIVRMLERHAVSASGEDVDESQAALTWRLLAHYLHPLVREKRGASDALRMLVEMGVAVAVETRLPRTIAELVARRLRWDERGLVRAVVGSHDMGGERSAATQVIRAMAAADVLHTSRVAAVCVSPAGLDQASLARCALVIGVGRDASHEEELRRHAHTNLVGSIGAVPGLIRRAATLRLPAAHGTATNR